MLYNDAKLTLMNNNQRKVSSFSKCEFRDATIAFFPFLSDSIVSSMFINEKSYTDEKILGLASLPIIVPNRIVIKGREGKTFCMKNRPLEFAFIDPSNLMSDTQKYHYWEDFNLRMKEAAFPTTWIFAPQETFEFFIRKCPMDKEMIYYHDPLLQKREHYFLLTFSDRLKSYRVSIDSILPVN